ncbi:futalosine hydrolase [Mucilaginibacter ginkgonis]|uniref:Futalosine hydrolase n=1 Tax=Mucilaginibacter ginkgonis TaxID=2682091 RepID=A0A6I4HZK2_9SPHI|nr:futalosine hydrolase [Mucilaginibacter ginkgonis]QQL49539.1 futalosine hydrolase [Mucilaginibacter ginkgonis]
MRLLIVAATEAEIRPLIENTEYQMSNAEYRRENSARPLPPPSPKEREPENKAFATLFGERKSEASYLVTGVGMVATAYALGVHLASNYYDLVINLGIAGSFDRRIALGNVVEIVEDTFTEMGAEDDEAFIPLDTLGFGDVTYKPNGHPFLNIPQVKAITVNKVHGNEKSIQTVVDRLNPQLESMEGAAFFYACEKAGVPGVQIRAVSNYVEKRNRDAWQIGLAVKNLNKFAVEMLNILRNT